MPMILSGHQPVYLPGIILFNKIALSDAFMFVGHCQYTKKSWQTRNRIYVAGQEHWLSVPVKTAGAFYQAINDTRFDGAHWKRKHLGTIRQAYQGRPFFERYFPQLETLLARDWDNLGDMNIALIKTFLDWLEIRTPLLDSRDYAIEGHKTDMLISMCRAAGADCYLSNEGARAYVDETAMAAAGIQHLWQAFEPPVYEQGHPFTPNLSLIDLLFNVGPDAARIVRACGRVAPGACAPEAARLKAGKARDE